MSDSRFDEVIDQVSIDRIAHPQLRELVDTVTTTARLAVRRAVAHMADPKAFPPPSPGTTSYESFFTDNLRGLKPEALHKMAALAVPRLQRAAKPSESRALVVDPDSPLSVADQVRLHVVAPRPWVAKVSGTSSRVTAAEVDRIQHPEVDALALDVVSLSGFDSISVGSVAIGASGTVLPGGRWSIEAGGDFGSEPLATFDLWAGGDRWPKRLVAVAIVAQVEMCRLDQPQRVLYDLVDLAHLQISGAFEDAGLGPGATLQDLATAMDATDGDGEGYAGFMAALLESLGTAAQAEGLGVRIASFPTKIQGFQSRFANNSYESDTHVRRLGEHEMSYKWRKFRADPAADAAAAVRAARAAVQ